MNLEEILKDYPKYRIKQIKKSSFSSKIKSWEEVSNLPKELRDNLSKEIPWMVVKQKEIKISAEDGSIKALLELDDGCLIETVLMRNARSNFTACLSTQVGCSIKCIFCNSGEIGFKRNLTEREIVDQYRFWINFLFAEHNKKKFFSLSLIEGDSKITNLVFMGMGEPFLNYINVRDAINEILKYTDIGQNHIVVSTIGIMDKLNEMLDDGLWPNVRLAISLHSAIDSTREKIIPYHNENFFTEFLKWAKKYEKKLASKNRHLSFEYVFLGDINDNDDELKALIKFLRKIGQIKINLIQYNQSLSNSLKAGEQSKLLKFQEMLKKSGLICTIRKSYGADIGGACGQLAGNYKI